MVSARWRILQNLGNNLMLFYSQSSLDTTTGFVHWLFIQAANIFYPPQTTKPSDAGISSSKDDVFGLSMKLILISLHVCGGRRVSLGIQRAMVRQKMISKSLRQLVFVALWRVEGWISRSEYGCREGVALVWQRKLVLSYSFGVWIIDTCK
jgi:hypothetical protein